MVADDLDRLASAVAQRLAAASTAAAQPLALTASDRVVARVAHLVARRLFELTAQQAGVVCRDELRAAGVGQGQPAQGPDTEAEPDGLEAAFRRLVTEDAPYAKEPLPLELIEI